MENLCWCLWEGAGHVSGAEKLGTWEVIEQEFTIKGKVLD